MENLFRRAEASDGAGAHSMEISLRLPSICVSLKPIFTIPELLCPTTPSVPAVVTSALAENWTLQT